MLQITATDLKANLGKYLAIAENEDILITKSGKTVYRLSNEKSDKVRSIESLFGIVQWNGELFDDKEFKAKRLAAKYESLD